MKISTIHDLSVNGLLVQAEHQRVNILFRGHEVCRGSIQVELNQPVAVLLSEAPATLALASAAGFRCFTSPSAFRAYVEREILGLEGGP